MKKPLRKKQKSTATRVDQELIRLNKFISNSGVCSRREADELIKAGTVKVNGVVVTELGTKVSPSDKVQFGGQAFDKIGQWHIAGGGHDGDGGHGADCMQGDILFPQAPDEDLRDRHHHLRVPLDNLVERRL